MSSYSKAVRAAAALVALMLAGCGFQPLYGKGSLQANRADLGQLRIEPIADRVGQITYNALRDSLNPKGAPSDPRHALRVLLREKKERLVFKRDATATRGRLGLKASYSIIDLATGKSVSKGLSRTTASYNIVQSDYATLVAEQDARDRVARTIAGDVARRVSICFSNQATCFRQPEPLIVPVPAPISVPTPSG